MNKVLFFGPYSPPVHGQSMAFKTIVDSFDQHRVVLIDYQSKKGKFLNSINSIFKAIFLLLLSKDIEAIYMTNSRSFLGSLKDVPLLLLGGILNKKIICHLHGCEFKSFLSSQNLIWRSILTLAYKKVSTFVVLTEAMKSEFSQFKETPVKVVKNFYPADFDSQKNLPPSRSTPLIISYFSNLLKSKGVLDFLEAAKMVGRKFPSVEFRVAGSPMDDHLMSKTEMEREVDSFKQNNREMNLHFLGLIKPENRFKFLSESSIMVLPSYHPTEAIPLVLIEAMRCGNAIITTNHNYLGSLVGKHNGILVDKNSPAQIAMAMENLILDSLLLRKIQEYNTKHAMDQYSQKKYTSDLKNIIEN